MISYSELVQRDIEREAGIAPRRIAPLAARDPLAGHEPPMPPTGLERWMELRRKYAREQREREKNERNRAAQDAERERAERVICQHGREETHIAPDMQHCSQCGQEFIPYRSKQVTCGKAECRQARKKTKQREWRKSHPRRTAGPRSDTCVQCGALATFQRRPKMLLCAACKRERLARQVAESRQRHIERIRQRDRERKAALRRRGRTEEQTI